MPSPERCVSGITTHDYDTTSHEAWKEVWIQSNLEHLFVSRGLCAIRDTHVTRETHQLCEHKHITSTFAYTIAPS